MDKQWFLVFVCVRKYKTESILYTKMMSLEKQEDLGRIRFYGLTVLGAMFGIECFCVEFGSHVINGKQPRNAFDLVNFSRTTEHTLTFKQAKQIYQESMKLERESNMDHLNTHSNGAHGDHNNYLNTSEEDEPPILKSPKHMNKRKASFIRNNSSSNHRSSIVARRNSKISKHGASTSRDSYSQHRANNGKLMVNETHNNGQIKIDIGDSDTDTDSDSDSEYDLYKQQRRTKNQSSPISLNIGSRHAYSHHIPSQTEQNKKRRRKTSHKTHHKKKKRNAKMKKINKIMTHSPRYLERQKKAKQAQAPAPAPAPAVNETSPASSTASSSSSSSTTHDNSSSSSSSSSKSDSHSKIKIDRLRLRNTRSTDRDTRPRRSRHRHVRVQSDKYKRNSRHNKQQKRKSTMQNLQIRVPKSSQKLKAKRGKRSRIQSLQVTTNNANIINNEAEKVRKSSRRNASKHDIIDEEEEEEDDEDRITFRRSLSADPRTIPHNEASKKKVKPRTVRVNKKEKEIVYKKEREKHDKFRIGDVVMVSLGKQEDLARIRFYGSTVLDANCAMFGIECFCVEFGSHVVNGCRVLDGSINGGDAVFCVKKAGYGTFIGLERIKSRKCLWNLKQSKNALKLTEFDCDVLVAAAKYGSLKVIKHLLRILLKKNSSARSRSRTRSNSYSSNAQYDKGEIQAIQTGFGYAVLHNHTKIVKMILTHFGSNNTSFNTIINNTKKKKKKTKSMTDFMIQRDLRPRTSSHTSGSSVGSDYDDEYVDEEVDDQTVNNSKLNTSRFYTSDLFDLVCERQNLSMLQILIEYDSWPLLSPSSRGLYRIFGSAGYLKWIKYLLEISPYIINMPLVSSDIHSTMMCTAMRHNRFEYTQYILSAFGTKLQQLQMDIPWPLLLVSIMNLNANTVHLPQAIDIQSQLLLHAPHQVNWCPAHCLREANQWLDIFDLIEVQYCDHQLTYYNGVVLGSILAAICHKSVTIYRTMKLSDEKQILHCLSDMLSTAMLYGIDFNQHNEFQHVWMTYDANKYRWNISNFPYNVCHTKQEFIFLQKMFKKALKKYPIKLLNTCCPFIDHQLIQIFKKIIIPYASYDALIFESLHWTKPINDTDQDLSEPESVEFMFAYQRSPVVE